ncbi:MAG: BREX-2 system phosphatase PglZ [Planctomycetaceae bacterium]
MTQAALTFKQIKAQLAAIRRKIPNTRSVAFRSTVKWTGNTRQVDGGETCLIHQCDSPLAMRLALREGGDSVTTVLITDLGDHEIGDDILVRLKPRKLVPLESWQAVKALFQARTIDPRITRYGWIAEMLVELNPTEDFPPVASGFLDAETVWTILLDRVIGLDANCPDLLALLKWSTNPSHVARFRSTSSMFREAAIEWLVTSAGPTVATVLHCVASNERPDALPIGLAAGVVFHAQAKGKLEKAAGKLEERYLGGQSPDPAIIDRWAASATEVVRLQLSDTRLKQQLLQRTDEILREVGAESHALLSDTSPLGFDLRLADFGKRLLESLSTSIPKSLDSLFAIRQSISQHDRHSRERRRLERVDMAMRLVRWIMDRDDTQEFKSLAEAASQHLAEGGFVDWARLTLRSGDPVRELSEAYAKLFDSVTSIRERQSRRFAELLQDWTASKTSDDTIVPVEQVLDRIVAPIATHKPVLVIVVDGMSVAVFRELMADVLGHDWVLLAEEGIGLRPAMATVPSVTEVSRTSLLCGRLMQGHSANEKSGFAEHPALLRACRSGFPPVLFHKAALHESDDASLAADIRREIGSSHRRIVGVVVNAVDDHLLKGEQIDTRWSRDEIKVLPVLLHEAKTAGRTVVMISDHGHILDCNAKGQAYEGGERWRMDDGSPTDGELRISGPRVVIPESKTLIAPWTERVRYGIKKNGYHGGVSPQEMIIPIAVLNVTDDFPAGWVEAAVDLPAWWDVATSSVGGDDKPLQKLKPQKPKEKPAGLLFSLDEEPAQQPSAAVAPAVVITASEWVATLLSSPVFEEQKRLGGRAVPTNEVLSRLLMAIDERGGKITSPALARSIQFSPTRLRGLLAIAQRVLNVDGFLVLTRDEASDTVELDRNLLCRQFDLV